MQLPMPCYNHLRMNLFGQVLHPTATHTAQVWRCVRLNGMKMIDQPMDLSEKRHFTFLLHSCVSFHLCIRISTRLEIECCGLFESYPNSYHSFLRCSKVTSWHQHFYEVKTTDFKSLILCTKKTAKRKLLSPDTEWGQTLFEKNINTWPLNQKLSWISLTQ